VFGFSGASFSKLVVWLRSAATTHNASVCLLLQSLDCAITTHNASAYVCAMVLRVCDVVL